MFHTRLKIIAISILHALYGRSGNKRSNLNELKFDVKFCEIKKEDLQFFRRRSSSYWPNVVEANIGISIFSPLGKLLGPKKPF